MISEFKGMYRWLSNFAPVSVTLDNVVYPSVENAYQAAKTVDTSEREQFQKCSASEAKQLGKRVTIRADWVDIRVPIMQELCTQKYSQQPYRNLLLATGDQIIQEGNYWNDTFWGICKGVGHNYLGEIIMNIRSKLKDPADKDITDYNWVAVIGSREPRPDQQDSIAGLINGLNPDTDAIISGCAYGIDAFALATANHLGFQTIGVLPWNSYNPEVQEYCSRVVAIDDFKAAPRKAAYDSVKKYHPAFNKLSQGALKLHARNYGIIAWASLVIAAPSNKPGGGGTGQGMRLAEALGIELVTVP